VYLWVSGYINVCVCVFVLVFMKIHFCIHSTATKNVDHKLFFLLFYFSYLCPSFLFLLCLCAFCLFLPCPVSVARCPMSIFLVAWTVCADNSGLTHGCRLSRIRHGYQWCSFPVIAKGNCKFLATNFILSRFYWRWIKLSTASSHTYISRGYEKQRETERKIEGEIEREIERERAGISV